MQSPAVAHTGGIVLCGGDSRRMGRAKAMLRFGPERMLQRVVRLVSEVAAPVVVVAAAGQEIPPLPQGVSVLRDRHPGRGPLEGLAVGLGELRDRAEAAFVTGCDVPLLLAGYVRRLIELSAACEIAVPHVAGFDEPLSAVYRTGVLPHAEALLACGRLRPAFLFDRVPTRRITADELIDVDPELRSLANVNSPGDYLAALARAGFEPPRDIHDHGQ